ncbi:MAG: amidohydrolase [Thermomicrobiales bacterium]
MPEVIGDLLLYNGHVLTMDPDCPRATAIAIRGGKVAAVGGDVDAREAAGSRADVIDLKGRTATPGLNDAHAHPMGVGFAKRDLVLASPPNASIQDLIARVAGSVRQRPAGAWIVGRGYDQARLVEQRHPTRYDLDAVSPDHPVLLIRACHHIGVANSRALALAGLSAATPDPDGGTIDRDEHGEPTGVVRETAHQLVRSAIGEPTDEEMAEALMLGGRAFLASGVTSTVEAGIYRPEEFHAYQRLRREGRLPVRTYLMMIIDAMLEPLAQVGIQTGMGDAWLRIGPAKLFSDGSIGGRTARMRSPYEGEAENIGLWMLPPHELKAKVLRAHRAGFQVGTHAIGDAAIDLVLDAYEEAMIADPRPNPRHRIEHFSIVDEAILARTARLGVIPVPGTSFLYDFRPAYVQNLGLDRLRYTYGMASYLRHGIIAAASTDAPVVSTSATIGLQTMMTRADVNGDLVWPEEAVTLHDALRAYTVNGAYASFEESIKGSLTPGKLGDVTVFETDLEQAPATEIGAVKIDLTIADGRIAYERPSRA